MVKVLELQLMTKFKFSSIMLVEALIWARHKDTVMAEASLTLKVLGAQGGSSYTACDLGADCSLCKI